MPVSTPRIHEMEYAVTDDVAIHFMGPDVPPVLSTPALVLWMESTSHENLGPLLGPGEDSVAALAHVRHLAATPLGMRVGVESDVVKADRRVYTFGVGSFDESEKVGEAILERASVAVA